MRSTCPVHNILVLITSEITSLSARFQINLRSGVHESSVWKAELKFFYEHNNPPTKAEVRNLPSSSLGRYYPAIVYVCGF